MLFKLVYITAPNQKESTKLANLLIRNKLAACVNIIPSVVSVYEWENKIVEDHECILIAKTTADKISALIPLIKKEHSYNCPVIIVLPIENGNQEYFNWIKMHLDSKSIRT